MHSSESENPEPPDLPGPSMIARAVPSLLTKKSFPLPGDTVLFSGHTDQAENYSPCFRRSKHTHTKGIRESECVIIMAS